MSAGCLCVHSSLGALPETASNWTMMYQFNENIKIHEKVFYKNLKDAIEKINLKQTQEKLIKQKEYIDYHFNWEKRTQEWIDFLTDMSTNFFNYQ